MVLSLTTIGYAVLLIKLLNSTQLVLSFIYLAICLKAQVPLLVNVNNVVCLHEKVNAKICNLQSVYARTQASQTRADCGLQETNVR